MLSPAHETIARVLVEHPSLLSALLTRMFGARAPGILRRHDSTLRAAPALEVRPDGVFQAHGPQGRWLVLEVQNRIDSPKRRRWPLAAAILLNQHGTMGDVLMLTVSRRVASWASRAASLKGPMGTILKLKPTVVLITPDHAETLLDRHCPQPAVFAAWSVHRRHGRLAERIVRRAVDLISHLPSPLRRPWMHAIVNTTNRKVLLRMKDKIDNRRTFDSIPLSPWAKDFIETCEFYSKLLWLHESLMSVLGARGLSLTLKQRRLLAACRDLDQYKRWLVQAATATTTREALARTKRSRVAHRAPAARATKSRVTKKAAPASPRSTKKARPSRPQAKTRPTTPRPVSARPAPARPAPAPPAN